MYITPIKVINDNTLISNNSLTPIALLIIFNIIPIVANIAAEYAYDIYFFL